MVLADRVRASVRTYGLWPRGGRVLVALSGGPDSTALLHLLRELQNAHEV
jgi:tRNA(Ile)-lysidine synthase TilS/MesJ